MANVNAVHSYKLRNFPAYFQRNLTFYSVLTLLTRKEPRGERYITLATVNYELCYLTPSPRNQT